MAIKKVLTKKEALKNAIEAIVRSICNDVYNNSGLKYVSDQYADAKANEIIKEMSIRFPIGE